MQQHDENDAVSRSQQPVSTQFTIPTTTTTLTTTTTPTTSADVALTSSGPGAGSKKRGRPPRAPGKSPAAAATVAMATATATSPVLEEEDVCFICFDGGNLVLCDRRGCPKAYHLACIKRDESFFRSKAKWNCGWHICSTCQKASHYMCYTCTYSLCKGCIKDADFVCVRGTFGLCGTCMRTIMLIENIAPGNKEMVQVDFDDKTSWEYLFKIYWVYLKTKLSLTVEELTQAKNPWKGDELPKARNTWRVAGAVAPSGQLHLGNGGKSMWSGNYYGDSVANHSKRTKTIDATKSDWTGVVSGVLPQPVGAKREVSSINGIESEKLWHYQDPTGTIQGPFPMAQLRDWSSKGHFPPDLKVWRVTEKQENSILLTDALVGKFCNEPPQPPVNFLHQGITSTSNDTNKKWHHGLNLNVDANLLDNPKSDASVRPIDNREPTQINKGDGFVKSLFSEHGPSSKPTQNNKGDGLPSSKPLTDQPQGGIPVLETKLLLGQGIENEKCTSSSININESTCKSDGLADNEKKRSDGDDLTQSDSSLSGFVSTHKPIETSKQNGEKVSGSHPDSTSKQQSNEDVNKVHAAENNKEYFCLNVPSKQEGNEAHNKGQATTENSNKLPFYLNVPLLDSQHNWSTSSSLAVPEWSGYGPAPSKPSVEEWNFNLVPASTLKPTVGTSDTNNATQSSAPWQPIITDAPDFCSFADESVSDLLAEVEAMESMGGFPSPTSKMSCGVGELARGPDHDFFSPVEGFSTQAAAPLPDHGKSDALSSTSTTDTNSPSQFIVANMLLQLSMPSRLSTSTDESGQELQMPPLTSKPLQSNFTDEPLVTSKPLQPSNISSQGEPLELCPKKPNGHSSSDGAEEAEDTRPTNVTNQNQARVETLQTPASSNNEREAAPVPKPPPAVVTKPEVAPDTHRPPPSASWETTKGNPKLGRETVHQQSSSATSTATAAGNQATWVSQSPRHGGDRHLSHLSPRDRDHRNHSHFRDSSSHGSRDSGGYGRDKSDRSSWNRQQYYGNGSTGGGSHRQATLPPKAMRVCKFYENGYCKKGASCSFWHP